ARAHCAVVLQRIQAIVLPHEPIKDGACGAPAPIELISIGENPRVTLSPPAVVTCDLAEALAGWMERDVQPLARKHLKSEIVKIETMSSYSCRNAYGRKKARLSEHGLANALDIGGFVTSSKKTADVLDDWGKPQRVIIAEQEAEKRAADAAAAKLAEAGLAANPMPAVLPLALPSTTGAAAAELARSTIIEGVPDAATAELVSAPASNAQTKLGGPVLKPAKKRAAELKAAAAPPPQPVGPAERTFLREAHKSACRIFGTTLGPEANEAHLNHFHLDMAERKFTKICD
ncbi:extensin family protein, partial [Hyphomicrobium sp.]|uniref:extensin family protein n=1 Tax=Hyphomicrobium sp. TaxID=82 RepID=UPI002D77777E